MDNCKVVGVLFIISLVSFFVTGLLDGAGIICK